MLNQSKDILTKSQINSKITNIKTGKKTL